MVGETVAVGVPDITPVLEFKLSPVTKFGVMEYVIGGFPPIELTGVNGVTATNSVSVATLITLVDVSAGFATVKKNVLDPICPRLSIPST